MAKEIKEDCFGFVRYSKTCNVLSKIDCRNCRFYKTKDQIKNNVFYPWSYSNKRDYIRDKKILEEVRKCMK